MKTKDGISVDPGDWVWGIVADGVCPYQVRESMSGVMPHYYGLMENAAADLVKELDEKIVDLFLKRDRYAIIAGVGRTNYCRN